MDYNIVSVGSKRKVFASTKTIISFKGRERKAGFNIYRILSLAIT